MKNIEKLYQQYLESSGLVTDSRKAGNNLIFLALKGENFDGNKFAGKALENGCKLAVVDDPEVAKDKRYFLVENTMQTLQELAIFHRDKLNIPIIGITGSNGKTTTKELMHSVLSRKYRTLATQGNLNNHIGVPLTLLKIKNEEIAIIEMGANHPGEIDFLSRIAKPEYGIITNIGKAHLEGFGSFEGVKKTKSELYRYLNEKSGTIFINGSNDILMELARLDNLNKIHYIGGPNPLCDGYILENANKIRVAMKFLKEGKTLDASINLAGSYNLENILAAACIGYYFDISPKEIIEGLESFKDTVNRSQFISTEKNQLISDAYNANPSSMSEAIRNFAGIEHPKKTLILGDMLELGKYSDEEHRKILEVIGEYGFQEVYLVGDEFYKYSEQYEYHFFESTHQLYEQFTRQPVNDCLILLKGSRGIALEKLLEVL